MPGESVCTPTGAPACAASAFRLPIRCAMPARAGRVSAQRALGQQCNETHAPRRLVNARWVMRTRAGASAWTACASRAALPVLRRASGRWPAGRQGIDCHHARHR